ncbi:MAG: hypothetical protein AAFX76_11160 [Planctomycetota bacterium]
MTGEAGLRKSGMVPLDGGGKIASDLACVGCDYNLRTCDPEGRCPECGIAVGRSAVGRYLCYFEPAWVQGLAWGMNRFAVAIVALAVTGLLGWATTLWPERGVPFWWIGLVFGVLPPVVIAFTLVGFFRATQPEPNRVASREGSGRLDARRASRVALIVGVAMILPAVVAGLISIFSRSFGAWSQIVLLVALMSWLAVPWCLLRHARDLALLVPRRWLARLTSLLSWGIVLTGAAWVWSFGWFDWYDLVVGPYDRVFPQTPNWHGLVGWTPGDPWSYHDDFREKVEYLFYGLGVGFGGALLGIVPLFLAYRNTLRREAAKAWATWASEPPTETPGH